MRHEQTGSLGRRLTRNLALKVLSLAMAVLIWLLVTNVNNPYDSMLLKDVRVQFMNEDSVTDIDKVFYVVDGSTVTLKVTERSSVLDRLSASNFTVVADMEAMTDMNAVPLHVTCDNAAVTWDEIEIYPSVMKVQLEQLTQQEFMITVTTNGERPANGYEVGTMEVAQGRTVQVAGPESLLNKIGKISAEVAVTGLSMDQTRQVVLQVYDKNGTKFDESQMERIQIKDSSGVLIPGNEVSVKIKLWEVMNDISVTVGTYGEPAEGYRITGISTVPVTVSLVGTQEALAKLDGKIVLEDAVSVEGLSETVTQEVDISTLLAEETDIRLIADAEPTISVTVQIEKTGDRTISLPLSSLELLNKPKGMTLTYSPADVIPVRIHSEDESVYSVSMEDIHGRIDLDVCKEEGSYEIPVEIELPDGYELASDVTIVVTSVPEDVLLENEVNTED